MADSPKIFALGDRCITVDFGNKISIELNNKTLSLASRLSDYPFRGFIEAVPAYSSVAVFYDAVEVRRNLSEFNSAFEAVSNILRVALRQPDATLQTDGRIFEIPVDFSERAALDLNFVASYANLSSGEVIDRFLAKAYRVYMIGFLPGFAYMGDVDERIAAPRKDSPRTRVPKGSVGIASRQTGIYPLESPGGWQIIGQTDIELFTPNDSTPSLLRAGDEVRFVPK
ncbi:MAG: 5-oxoprolinase subunit PxpB [Acidobacteriota bacterium]